MKTRRLIGVYLRSSAAHWFSMRNFSLLVVCSITALAQPAPQFTVADIRPSTHSNLGGGMRGPFFGDNRFEVRYATMVDLIHAAYGVDAERVFDGPNWLEMDRFDIIAVVPPRSTAESRNLMLQALLADRFKLKVHSDTRPTPAYKITAGKSPKLQESSSTESSCDFKIDRMPNPGPPPAAGSNDPSRPIQMPIIAYTCKGVTMAAFASYLPGLPSANQVFNNKPVVDQTGLAGAYDFTLRFTPALPRGMPVSGDNLPLMDAVDQQLGLKLEPGTAPMAAIVVDSAEEKPTPNPSAVEKSFPPVPTEFDVAEIKPSPPGQQMMQPEVKNGRVIIPGITVQNLMTLAWNIGPQTEIVNAPKWLNTDRFDVIAKAPAGVALGNLGAVMAKGSIPLNIDALQPMLKALLIDRFKMQTHMEERPKNAYTLVAVKPTMQKADPTHHTNWSDEPATPAKGDAMPGARTTTFHNITMAEFARALPDVARGEINEVEDATGLEGRWDFSISYTMSFMMNGGPRGGGDGAPAQASDPTGGLSFTDAVAKQLGLKLEQQKRPQPVLVIDHIDPKPSEN